MHVSPIDSLLYATWSNRFYTVSCNESSCLTISCRCITRIAKGLFHPYDVFRMTYDLKNRSFLMRFLSLGGDEKKELYCGIVPCIISFSRQLPCFLMV